MHSTNVALPIAVIRSPRYNDNSNNNNNNNNNNDNDNDNSNNSSIIIMTLFTEGDT